MLRVLLVLLVILGSLPPSLSYGHGCEQDSLCWHDFPLIMSELDVSGLCVGAVEAEFSRESRGFHGYDMDFTNGSVFTKVRWKDKTKGILQYWGDRLKLKDDVGQWIPMEYTCDFGFNGSVHPNVQLIKKEESKLVR